MLTNRQKVLLAGAGSALLHAVLLLGVGLIVALRPPEPLPVAPPAPLHLEIVKSEPELSMPPAPTPEHRVVDNSMMEEAEHPPTDSRIEGDKNTVAASEVPGTGDQPLPDPEGPRRTRTTPSTPAAAGSRRHRPPSRPPPSRRPARRRRPRRNAHWCRTTATSPRRPWSATIWRWSTPNHPPRRKRSTPTTLRSVPPRRHRPCPSGAPSRLPPTIRWKSRPPAAATSRSMGRPAWTPWPRRSDATGKPCSTRSGASGRDEVQARSDIASLGAIKVHFAIDRTGHIHTLHGSSRTLPTPPWSPSRSTRSPGRRSRPSRPRSLNRWMARCCNWT